VSAPFTLFADGEALSLAGTVDTWSAERFSRMSALAPEAEPLVVDVSRAEFVDHRMLLALNDVASEQRPVHVRGSGAKLPQLLQMIGVTTPHLVFD
jgi:hypothetical protein